MIVAACVLKLLGAPHGYIELVADLLSILLSEAADHQAH
jgi:hypothetical protein